MGRFQNTGQPDWDWWGKLWPTPGATLRKLGLSSGDSLAEVGSGNGYFALPAARIVAPAPVYAIDLDADLLEELDQLAGQHGIGNIEPVHGDARSLGAHLSNPVDVALIANSFHGVQNLTGFVDDVASTLAEDGRVTVVNWRDRPRETTTVGGEPRGPPTDLRLSADETQQIVAEATDLTLSQHVDLPPYHYALTFER